MERNNMSTKKMVSYGLLMALTTVMTMFIHIPSPATKGYVNVGDMMVILAAMLYGGRAGFLIGGVGSALADLLLGYTYFAPITLVVKGLEALIAGSLLERDFFQNKKLVATSIAGLFMALGYLLAEALILGYGFGPALASFPGNIVQGLVGAVASVALYKSLSKIEYFKQEFHI